MAMLAVACRSGASDGDQAPPGDTPAAAAEGKAEAEPSKLAVLANEPIPEPASKLIKPVQTPPAEPSKIEVKLPAAPTYPTASAPEKHPDGAYSVRGLRVDRDARIDEGEAGTEITVRGYVAKIYVPPTCPAGDVCPPAKQPHLWITDQPDERGLKRALMVVNYRFSIPEWDAERWRGEPDVVLEQGKRYTFKGRFKRFSDTGFAHQDGLLEFVAYRPLDPSTGAELESWVYPPGAAWHPQEIARMEEENARLMERARKEAARRSR